MSQHNIKKKHASKHAFTLVELIVVITILAILGTIGFLSLWGYSSNARDSQRLSDMNNISKSLDAYVITSGSYPTPDNSFSVTYSGGVLWYQGTFGASALSKLGGTGINKRPVDPLKSTEYTYSTLAYGKAYSLKAEYEGNLAMRNPFIETAYAAAGSPTTALIRGNYGGLSAKTQTGSTIYVLAVPSIVTNTGSSGQVIDVSGTALSGTLLFNGKNLSGASAFNPNVVVFSGASLPTDDSSSQITNMMTALKNAYSSSDVASVQAVSTLINTPAAQLANLGNSVINAQLGGKSTVTASSLPSCAAYSGATTYSAWNCFTFNGATVTVTAAGIGTSSTKADSSCSTNDIAVWQSGTTNVQIWSACNVWATTTTGYDTVPAQSPNPTTDGNAPSNRVTAVQWNYYQWGRNDNVTTGTYIASQYNSSLVNNSTSDTNFYKGDGYGEWYTPESNNPNPTRWNIANGGNNQGPCQSGYHVPSGWSTTNSTDWGKYYTIINSASAFGSCNQANLFDRMRCTIALPLAGFRNSSTGQYQNQGVYGYYTSSTPAVSSDSYYAYFNVGGWSMGSSDSIKHWYGISARCIRN